MKKTSSPSGNSNATKKFSSLNLNFVHKPNGRPGQNGRMLLGTVKKGVVKKAPPPAAPKPLNLPSQKKENAGYDPKIALVPSGSAGWNDAPPNGQPSADERTASAPMPMSNTAPATPTPSNSAPPPQETPPSSGSPAKSVAWGGRGMQKPDPTTPPAPPPQVPPPARPVADPLSSRFMNINPAGMERWSSQSQNRLRPKPAGEQWPTLAPEEADKLISGAPNTLRPSNNGGLLETVNTDRDDAWADVDDEMTYDDAENLFDDAATKDGAAQDTVQETMSPEQAHAIQVMKMEAKLEAEERKQEEQKREQERHLLEEAQAAAAASKAARIQEEKEQMQEQLRQQQAQQEPEPEPVTAAPAPEPVKDLKTNMDSAAMSARERRQREEEERQAQQKARADAALKRLEDMKREREKRETDEKAALLEKQKQDEAERWRHREVLKNEEHKEPNKWQQKNQWNVPERVESDNWRGGDAAGDRPAFAPVGIMQRDTTQSRRKLWVPENSDKAARAGDEQRTGGKAAGERADRERQPKFLEKKFGSDDGRNWRERATAEKEKEKEKERDDKKKRDSDKKKDRDAKKNQPAKGEKKGDAKAGSKEDKSQGNKKDTAMQLPAPKPKEDDDSTEKASGEPSETVPKGEKNPDGSWSYNKLRKYCEGNGLKKWCESQNITVKMNDKDDLLAKHKLWAQARDKGEIPAKEPKKTRRGGGNKKENEKKKNEDAAPAEDTTTKDKSGRKERGGRKNRKEEPTTKPAKPKDEKAETKKEEPKAEPKPDEPAKGLTLDDTRGLQDIHGGLKVGSDGGFAVVEAHEMVEDDSGFTTEVGKKEKKEKAKAEAAEQEKARRKEAAKAKQQEKEAKARAEAKAKADAKNDADVKSSAPNAPTSPQDPMAIPSFIPESARAAADAKPAWTKPSEPLNAPNFNTVMIEQKFDINRGFGVPAPGPHPGGSARAAPGAERSKPSADPWSNPSAVPVGGFGNQSTIPFDNGFGNGFANSGFNSGLGLHTLNSGNAQFTALPTFNQGLFGNAFAATSVDAGWGAPSTSAPPFTPGKELDPTAPTVANPNAEWSGANQKPVGNPVAGANTNGKADGKGGDKQNRKSRGGKGRTGKDNKAAKDHNNAKGKGKGGESDKTNRGGNRQNRGGKNQSNGSKPDKGSASVEASVPAKNGNRRGGHHANKKANDGKTTSDKN